MNYPLYIARKLALGSDGRKSSPGVKVAVAAIALSVAVMSASIAIVLGFKSEIRDKVTGFTSHITMTIDPQPGEDNVLTLTPTLRKILDSRPYIADYALQTSIPVILKTPTDFKGVFLKNLDDNGVRNFIKENIIAGRMPDYSADSARNHVVLSRLAASQLGLNQGDRLDCYFINDDVKTRRLTVAAIYDSHFDAYDDLMLYGSRQLTDAFSGLKANQGSSLLISVKDFSRLDESTASLRNTLDRAMADGTLYRHYDLENAHVAGANYFHWLSMLDTNVAVVLTLMMVVGCVTLISGMLTIILDKKRFIGLMKALGAPTSRLRRVFVYLAMRVALIGMLLGNALIIAFLLIQDKTHFLKLDASSYYIDFVPVQIDWTAIALLNAAVLAVVYLVLIFPTRIVAGITPASTLKAE